MNMFNAEGSLIALDLGTRTGVATTTIVPEGTPTSLKLETVVLATDAELRRYKAASASEDPMRDFDPRIQTLWTTLNEKIKTLPSPVWVAFEDVRFAKSLAQAQLWSSFRGAVWSLPIESGRFFSVNTSTLKKFAGAKGAKKDAMMVAFRKRFSYTGPELDDNLVDAAWILTWALETKFATSLKSSLS